MPQKGFTYILLLFVVIALTLFAVGFILVNVRNNRPDSGHPQKFSGRNKCGFDCNEDIADRLPSCTGNDLLTDSPIDVDKINRIIPLGHITPVGSHSTPMEHIEIVLPSTDRSETVKTDIKAPGAIHIFGIRQSVYIDKGSVTTKNYYSIGFSPCKEVIFYFENMGSLSPSLQKAVDLAAADQPKEVLENQKEGSRQFQMSTYRVDYVTKPGEIIGTAGGPGTIGGALEWGSYDMRLPALGFLRGDIQDLATTNATCPLDYYPASLKTELYGKLQRKAEPRCGENMQDKTGTIQGNWVARVKKDLGDDGGWRISLGIVHDNLDPSIGVIGVGGTISTPGRVDFPPQHIGYINREPSEVTADGKFYCYQSDIRSQYSGDPQLSGRLIIQLVDDKTLKIEHQEKSCDEDLNFISPTIYQR